MKIQRRCCLLCRFSVICVFAESFVTTVMNSTSESFGFIRDCQIFGETHEIITQFPSNLAFGRHLVVCVLNGIIFLFGISSNSIIIFTFWRSPHLKENVLHFLVMILSSVGCVASVLCNLTFTVRLASETTGLKECWLHFVQKRVTIATSIFSMSTITAINIDRYLSVLHPHYHRTKFTKSKLLVVVKLVWLICVIFIALSFYSQAALAIFSKAATVVFIMLTIYCYARITWVAIYTKRKSDKRSMPVQVGEVSGTRREQSVLDQMSRLVKEIKSAKTCFFIVTCYIVCYMPMVILKAISPTEKLSRFTAHIASTWCLTLVMCNSSLNSFIFFWRNGQLRNESKRQFLKTFNCS